MTRRWMVGLAAIVALAGFAYLAAQPAAPANETRPAAPVRPYTDLAPAEFRELSRTQGATVVNVHVPEEGSIPDTHLQIAYDQIRQQVARLPQDRSAKLAIYCMSGRMSEIAARELADLGYTNIYNLRGGMVAWREAGFPLVR